jgi:putative flippase GtrA
MSEEHAEEIPRPASRLLATLGIVVGIAWCGLVTLNVVWVSIVEPVRAGRTKPWEILGLLAIGLLAGALIAWPGFSSYENGRRLRNHPTPGYVKSVLASLMVMTFCAIALALTLVFDTLLPTVAMGSATLVVSVTMAVVLYVFAAWQIIRHDQYEHVHFRDVASRNVVLLLAVAIGFGVFQLLLELQERIPRGNSGLPLQEIIIFGIPMVVAWVTYRFLMWKIGVRRYDRKEFVVQSPGEEN